MCIKKLSDGRAVGHKTHRSKEQGIVLIVALVVLAAMMLAGVAMMRSVDTGNIIAGNMAFQQAANHSADMGVDVAVQWLNDNPGMLGASDPTNGYNADGNDPANNPGAGQSWDSFWQLSIVRNNKAKKLATDPNTGNTISYVIDRLCDLQGAQASSASCSNSPVLNTKDEGNNQGSPDVKLNGVISVYYRITVRVAGPRNTVSYVQTVVAI